MQLEAEPHFLSNTLKNHSRKQKKMHDKLQHSRNAMNGTTCPADASTAMNNYRRTIDTANLLRAVGDLSQALLLFLSYQEHEVEESSGRMWHSIVGPACELQVGDFP